MSNLFGWVPFEYRSTAQNETHDRIVALMPVFPTNLLYRDDRARVSLWKAGFDMFGRFLKYNFQQTGSCVGAGGGNMAKTLMAVEIVLGHEAEEYRELWWPFTYGRSRYRAGMKTPGEGSLGSSWAEAAVQDGFLAQDEKAGLPQFEERDNWLAIPDRTEVSWSDGDAQQSLDCMAVAKTHLIKAVAPLRSSADWKAAIQNGYPVTLASNFGTRGIRARGTPPVNIGEWNDNWPHQMYSDEAWDHPTEGLILRIGNNWSSNAHPAPTQGEPPGGFYITAATADRICRAGEVYAFSAFAGFPTRTIPWIFA